MTRVPAFRSGRELVARLVRPEPLLTVELRPPARHGTRGAGVESWIDLHHAVRRLTTDDTLVFVTDSAVGAPEEESLRHLKANVGGDADPSRVVPFLTSKHALSYCLRFPDRAFDAGHRAVVILGGDKDEGPPRCVDHAVELRRRLRQQAPRVALGGWANPYRDPAWQVDLLAQEEGVTDFFVTQVVSHHDLEPVERFLDETSRRNLSIPTLFGVFFYRSASPRTLGTLSSFLPVPTEALQQELGVDGVSPVESCARTVRALMSLGVRGIYLCNLPPRRAPQLLAELRRAIRTDS